MLCVRCGSSNPIEAKLCQRCGAILPRSLGSDPSSESASESLPSYRNDAIESIDEELESYLRGEGDRDALEESVLLLEERLVALLEILPETLESLSNNISLLPDESAFRKIQGLLDLGVGRFNTALDLFYQALEMTDEQTLSEQLGEIRRANDEICHAGVLLDRLLTQL